MSGEKLRALIDKYIDGDLTQEERDELNSFLDNSPENARMFWREMRQHWLTRDILLKNEGVVLAKKEDEFVSEARYIETKTHSGRRSRKKAFPLIWTSLAACIMLMVGAYIFNLWQASRTGDLIRAEFIEIKGDVKLIRNGTEYRVNKGMDIGIGDSVYTGPSGSVTYKYKDEDTVIRLFGNTRVNIYQMDTLKMMYIHKGTVTCNVAPQQAGHNMRLDTPDMAIHVKGTEFRINVSRKRSSINVIEGSVEVSTLSGGSEQVRSGEIFAIQPKLVVGPVPNVVAKGSPDYISRTGRAIIQGDEKAKWRIKQSSEGIIVAQTNPDAFQTAVVFEQPRMKKGSITCEIRVISVSKRGQKKDEDGSCFAFFWLFLDGKPVQNLLPQTNLKIWDPLKGLKKGEWYRLRIMFELKQSKDKGTYLYMSWGNFTDISGKTIPFTIDTKQRNKIYGPFEGPGSIGVGVSRLSAEWRNIKIKSIE
ncbi:FecR domain-containing protein [Planctomycetota bacterium]